MVSATLVAVTVNVVVVVTFGAVSNPPLEILPFEAVQVTAGLEALLTVAENCWLPPEVTFADRGVIETDTAATGLTETEA